MYATLTAFVIGMELHHATSQLEFVTAESHTRAMTAGSAKLAILKIHILVNASEHRNARISVEMRIAKATEPAPRSGAKLFALAIAASPMTGSTNAPNVSMHFSHSLTARRDSGSYLSQMLTAKTLTSECQEHCSVILQKKTLE
jgi:hypothetical protein